MRPDIHLARRASPIALIALVALTALAAPTWVGSAGRAVAGDPSDPVVLEARARALLTSVDIHPHHLRVARSPDRAPAIRLDSVTGLDAADRPIVDVDWDATTGRLRTVTRYVRDIGPLAPRSGRDGVETAATGYLRRVELGRPAEAPRVIWDEGMASWQALWTRRVDGIPAPEDFMAVWILPDAGLRALSDRTGSPVAGSSVRISAAEAQRIVQRAFDETPASPSVTTVMPRLEWRHPNDFLDPTASGATDPSLRLVHVVPYRVAISASESGEGVLWVDAGTGALVGGGAIP